MVSKERREEIEQKSNAGHASYMKAADAWHDAGNTTPEPGSQVEVGWDTPKEGESHDTPQNLRVHINKAVQIDAKFYGHYLPSHFKKTRIISTNGR